MGQTECSEIQLNCTWMKKGAVRILHNKALSLVFRSSLTLHRVVKFQNDDGLGM